MSTVGETLTETLFLPNPDGSGHPGATDMCGCISVTTGTTPAASATVVTVNFGAAYSATPKGVVLMPANTAAAALTGTAAVWVDQASTTTAHFVLKVGSTALAASTAYLWYYQVIG